MRNIPALQCSVSDFGRMYRPPLFMASDTFDKQFGNGIKRKFAWLSYKYIRASHQQVACIHSFKNILVPESVYPFHFPGNRSPGKSRRLLPVVEMFDSELLQLGNFLEQVFPYIFVISDIDIKSCFSGLNVGE